MDTVLCICLALNVYCALYTVMNSDGGLSYFVVGLSNSVATGYFWNLIRRK